MFPMGNSKLDTRNRQQHQYLTEINFFYTEINMKLIYALATKKYTKKTLCYLPLLNLNCPCANCFSLNVQTVFLCFVMVPIATGCNENKTSLARKNGKKRRGKN